MLLPTRDPDPNLLIIGSDSDDDAAYAAVNIEILNQAAALAIALNDRPIAVLVWEGIPARSDGPYAGVWDCGAREGRCRLSS